MRLLTREQVLFDLAATPLEPAIYSNVEGCPIDAIMLKEGVQRWMAVCLLLAERGTNARQLAMMAQRSKLHLYEVLKGNLIDVPAMECVADFLGLPMEQVFCYGDKS